MKPYTIILVFCLTVLGSKTSNAQDARQKLMSERIAFFTERIDLSPKEAQAFWPLYNEYKEKGRKINEQKREINNRFKGNVNTLSEKEIKQLLTSRIVLMNEEVLLIEEYQKKFLEILPPKKVMLIYTTETEFKTYLIQQLRSNRNKNLPGIRN